MTDEEIAPWRLPFLIVRLGVWCIESETDDLQRKIREELADVLSYCILMADVCGLDLDEIMNEKVTKNEAKYPVEKARGSAAKYTEL